MTALVGIEPFSRVGVVDLIPSSHLAHQGGWDEILIVAGPLAIIGVLLWIANRRVSAQLARHEQATGTSSDSDQPTS